MISSKASDDQWQQLSAAIVKADFSMTVAEVDILLRKVFKGSNLLTLSGREKEALWESFKVRQALEDNPDVLEDRLVSLHALLNSRRQSGFSRIQKLLI
jgi:hypothetical protein